jgi:hypothetical protein
MSPLPAVLIYLACGVGIAYLIYREARTQRREDRQWERELAAAEREDARLAGRDTRREQLEALYELPARDPEHVR